MEYVCKINIFGLKMMMKSGRFVLKSANSVMKMTHFAHGGISIKNFVMYVHILYETLSHKFHPYCVRKPSMNQWRIRC